MTADLIPEFKKALIKDFEVLYVKEFTLNWEEERMVRHVEINIMDFPNVKTLLERIEPEER